MEPREVDEVTFAFPAGIIPDYLPEQQDIPEHFHDTWARASNYWCDIANKWFAGQLPEDFDLYAKEGVDAMLAGRHVETILRSYQPRHEHKIAGVGYLMSLWFRHPDELKEEQNDTETDNPDAEGADTR